MLKNSYPRRVLDNIIKSKVNKLVCNEESNAKVERNTFYVKLPYIGKFSGITRQRIVSYFKRFCNDDFNIKLVFSSFKIRSLFGVKDPIPKGLRSLVVYKFTCSSSVACYVGETSRHFSTRINENLKTDKASHVYKHLMSCESGRQKCTPDCFSILDQATYISQLKIKEAIQARSQDFLRVGAIS